MNIFEQYINQSHEIIGIRTKDEEKFDKEVLRWLRKGKNIRKALRMAGKRYPQEALKIDESKINYVAEHYEYLLMHEEIIQKIRN